MTDTPYEVTADRRASHALAWLLLVPVLLVAYPPLYNRSDPQLFGVPFFYWYQLAVIPVSVVCTTAVYRAGRRRRSGGSR
jgi:Protein of unknown function (DUF3311)